MLGAGSRDRECGLYRVYQVSDCFLRSATMLIDEVSAVKLLFGERSVTRCYAQSSQY